MVAKEVFRELALFSNFTDGELEKLGALFSVREYGSGQIVVAEGGPRDEVVILLEGSVSIEMTSALKDSSEPLVISHESTRGRIIEWSSAIDAVRGGESALVRAVEPSRVLAADGASVKELCDREPTLGYKFVQQIVLVVASRLRDTRGQFLSVCSQFWWPGGRG
jgi:signal-transduction protein with cAMP-binding, CBS, and nucleotidyltransferase domain